MKKGIMFKPEHIAMIEVLVSEIDSIPERQQLASKGHVVRNKCRTIQTYLDEGVETPWPEETDYADILTTS